MKIPSRLSPWLLIVLLTVAAVVRFWDLGGKSLWVDEIKGLKDCAPSLWAVYEFCVNGHTPPLREVILHFLVKAPREHMEAVTRIPSALAGALTVPLVYLLGRFLFGSGAGLFGALLLLLHPWHILHSQDGRMHAVFLFMAALNLYIVARLLLGKPRWYLWGGWGILAAVYASFTYLAAFPILALAAWALWEAGKRFLTGRKDPAKKQEARRIIYGSLLAAGVFFILFGPWMMVAFRIPERIQRLISQAPSLSLSSSAYGEEPTDMPSIPPLGNLGTEPTTNTQTPAPVESPFTTHYNLAYFRSLFSDLGGGSIAAAVISLLFALIGFAYISSRRCDHLAPVIFWFGVPVPVMFFTSLGNYFPSRYVIFYLALYLPLCGCGAYLVYSWLCAKLNRISSLRPQVAIPLAAVIILGPLLALQSRQTAVYFAQEKQDWRGAVRFLEKYLQEGDVVIPGDHWTHFGLYAYVQRPMPLVHALSLGAFQKALEQYPKVWYIYWAPLPPYIQEIANQRLMPVATFPGLLGDIRVMHTKDSRTSPITQVSPRKIETPSPR